MTDGELHRALLPFAKLGLAFLKDSPRDDSSWTDTPDETLVQVGAAPPGGWSVTVGQLRAIARAYEELGGTYYEGN